MKAVRRTLILVLACGSMFGLVAGCNSLIGADAPIPVDSLGGAGGLAGASGAFGVAGGQGCVLASDCPDPQICLFQQCSKQCAADKDCQFGRCLQTSLGTACVVAASALCVVDGDCPEGSRCLGRACRGACNSDAECLIDQSCINRACVGNDAAHDPSTTGGAGGSSGEAGASGGSNEAGAGGGGVPGGGRSGAGGSAGTGGHAGSGGTGANAGSGAAGGNAGSGGVSDGTATGSLGAACSKNGAFACAGHGQRGELVCQNGSWQSNGTCSGSTLCDTTPGGNAGSCQPIISECTGKAAGFRFCRGTETDLRECGVDLVTATAVQSCGFVCSGGSCTGVCHPKDKQCKTGGVVPQLCADSGSWQDQTACTYQCDAATGNCIAAGCKDNVKNGDETDKDCGGSCGGCAVGGKCLANTDCLAPTSAHCASGTCALASCSDGVLNGNETDKDCGGSCAADCAVGLSCAGNADCLLPDSGHCSGGKCIAASCTDGVQNGTETGKDCGGSCAADCALGDGCGLDADCVSGACLANKCVACKPSTKRCVGTSLQTCTATGDWGTGVACTVNNGSPSCVNGVCGIAGCNPGFGDCDSNLSTGCETNLDLPGACGTTCANRIVCSISHGTPSCPNGACVMACDPGYGDCVSTANDGCEKVLNSVTSCGTCSSTMTCTAPAQKCAGGACVTNTPYNLGQSSTTGALEFDPPSDYWYVVPVQMPKDATLLAFRLNAVAIAGLARMALWADDGSGNPGAFLAQTGNIMLAAGLNGATPAPKPPLTVTQLTGGKLYWVGAKFTGGARIYQNSAAGASSRTLAQAFSANPVSTLDPFPSGSSGVASGTAYSLFVEVQDVPP